MKTVITFGTFDLLHIGHINIIRRAKEYGDTLVVGVSSDALNFEKKKTYPVYNEYARMEIVNSIKGVDKVFVEESLEKKREYIIKYSADVLVMGSDWEGKFDFLRDVCDVYYIPRTENVSTSDTKRIIRAAVPK